MYPLSLFYLLEKRRSVSHESSSSDIWIEAFVVAIVSCDSSSLLWVIDPERQVSKVRPCVGV